MLVKITDTNEMKTLAAIDAKTNTEYTGDLLGHYDALVYDADGESLVMDTETFDWWDEIITEMNRVDQLVQEYRSRFEGVDEVLWAATEGVYDLDRIPAAEEAALKEAFGDL